MRLSAGAANSSYAAVCIAALFFLLFMPQGPVAAEERPSDEYLKGYAASVLERELGMDKEGYCLTVSEGAAAVTILDGDAVRRDEAERKLRVIEGMRSVDVRLADTCGSPGAVGSALGLTGEGESLPEGDPFTPLLADPKQPRFFVSLNRYDSSVERYTVGSVGYGETFGLYRWKGPGTRDGFQLGIAGALFAQFNMDTASHDLINADYTIGIPLTYRSGANSARLRVYHQSSHLGDEYLLRVKPQRVNLSFESVELIYSRDWHDFRVYAGGECLIHREPADLKPWSAHWGAEYVGGEPFLWKLTLVGGLDMKCYEEHNWSVDTSAKAGVQFGGAEPGKRRLRLLAQWYKGFDPHGQFYTNKIEFYGIELSLGF